MKIPGFIVLRAKVHEHSAFDFVVECHTEDEEAWGGYEGGNPFKVYSKRTYAIVHDERREMGE